MCVSFFCSLESSGTGACLVVTVAMTPLFPSLSHPSTTEGTYMAALLVLADAQFCCRVRERGNWWHQCHGAAPWHPPSCAIALPKSPGLRRDLSGSDMGLMLAFAAPPK